MALNFKEVAEIMKIIDSSNCEEMVLESDGTRLVVRRGGSSTSEATHPINTPLQQAVSADVASAPKVSLAPLITPEVHGNTSDVITERSPMVGTFYSRPSPDEAPYVEVGTKVSVGDPLCMIEVMKLYTTIAANVGGIVEAIIVEDATLVEFDQPLFVIRPD